MPDFADIKAIRDFKTLIKYLRMHLGWPVDEDDADDLTFEYDAKQLGLDEKAAVKIRQIKQLRPLVDGQPWGIFWIDFEPKRLPVVVMRRVLGALVIKKRGGRDDKQAAWNLRDLMFISATGEGQEREISLAHFQQESGDLPTLRVLGWDGGDTLLKLEHIAVTLEKHLRWPDDPNDQDAWREEWSVIFRHRIGHVIRTADALADQLALLARRICGAALALLQHESENGSLRRLHKAFQVALIHDLNETDFADTYAQTITYGLLTAAISRTDMSGGQFGTALVAENVTDMVPITNPFLREMLQTFLQAGGRQGGINFDELGIQEVVELLRGDETDLPAILRDFGNRSPGEDPVIIFYEHFLTSYNKKLKIQRGVFYTPKPVVSYIVRSVHELLQTEFGLEDGLADITTWGEMEQRMPGLKRPPTAAPDSPFVTVLDPATGTATFLVEVIDVIHKTLIAKWEMQHLNKTAQKVVWNEYVPKHLLPRLYGYELMMAPYAIAHMKIGLKLHETGYHFKSDERVRVYLTNTLEPSSSNGKQLSLHFDAPALAHESLAVNFIKKNQFFTVVMGNPPYSDSVTENGWITKLIKVFKDNLGEQKADLNREEWKFLRISYEITNLVPLRIIGFVINNAFLKAITHRKMREFIAATNDSIYITNLHGSSKPPEFVPENVQTKLGIGKQDINVFDIQQGVTIFISMKNFGKQQMVRYLDLWGERERKYKYLEKGNIDSIIFQELKPHAEQFFFIPRNNEYEDEYMKFWSLTKILESYVSGIQSGRDEFVSTVTDNELKDRVQKIEDFQDWSQIAPEIEPPIWDGFSLSEFRKAIKNGEKFLSIWVSKPFDIRPLIYHPTIIKRMRGNIMASMQEPNIGFCIVRQLSTPFWQHVLAVNSFISDTAISQNSREYNYLFPLYLYEVKVQGTLNSSFTRSLNLSVAFANAVEDHLGWKVTIDNAVSNNILAIDIFNYLYALLHSLSYRQRYTEFLKIDFPRLPLTSDPDLFWSLCDLGEQLVALHLLKSPKLDISDDPIPVYFIGSAPSNLVAPGYPKFDINHVMINLSEGFENVPDDVWNFQIGGYQVCHKWLKDRRGRQLSQEDIIHYQKIVVAIQETIRLMSEIDEVIEEHGGWPIQ